MQDTQVSSRDERTYLDHILEQWDRETDTEALVQGPVRLTRAEARDTLFRIGHALLAEGLEPGDAVGLFLANRPEGVLAQLAVHLIGCRVVFLPPEPGRGELAALAGQADVRAIVFDPLFAEHATALPALMERPPRLLGLGPADGATDLLAAAGGQPATRPAAPVLPADEAMTVLYTGGTLGNPKLAGQGRALYDRMVDAVRNAPWLRGHRVLAATLITHGSGHLVSVQGLVSGATVVLLPGFEAGHALSVLREERINSAMFVPPMLYELLDHPDCRPGGFPHMESLFVGGAATAPERLRQAGAVFGPVIGQGYGQSEALGITLMLPDDYDDGHPERWASVGRVIDGVEVEIRDEDGTALPDGATGELYVRGETVMRGYYRDPERTAAALRDGWLATGDMGYRDPHGYLYLVDRAKDIIVTGRTSDNVYSRVLEDFLLSLDGVRNAAAVGVPDERYGEAVHVFLATDKDDAVDPAAVGAAVVAELGELYEPRHITQLRSLPLTRIGKVDKKALRALLSS
ncbi:AMP-binding protein [Streptomyces caatingaensis]|uniref:Long-chain fatty acid--CoA ligase n=1 Tax=Streptomyces caatingaensis TaxID=1678637 RepID=A0A0K9XMI1_9ACTN|nr:AMP-binding protein [Streptomyces caatingaensis]KNB53922.1 long-chain fatty acid--CoA ligase [Streptomyces caatingaensis]